MKRERLRTAIARIKLSHQDWQKMRPKTTTNAAKTSPTIPAKTAEESRQLFRKAAKRLRDRTLRDFLANELPRFQRLNETLEKKWGLPVPTLSVCGSGTEEIRFTKLLGWHLDCRNPHGLQGLLGRALGETVLGEEHPDLDRCETKEELWLGTTPTRTEKTKENYIDLRLEFGDTYVYIEQKIGSAEGHDQLKNYADCIEKLNDGKRDNHLLFLTPEGREPTDERWKALSYREVYCRLALVLKRHALSPMARYNLKALLWDLMLGPIAQNQRWVNDLKKHVAKVVKKPKHEYTNLSRWLNRYNLGADERRILLDITEE